MHNSRTQQERFAAALQSASIVKVAQPVRLGRLKSPICTTRAQHASCMHLETVDAGGVRGCQQRRRLRGVSQQRRMRQVAERL